MATTAELRDEVLAHQFSAERYGTRIEKWLDEAQKYIVRQAEVRTENATQSYVTVNGTQTLDLPSNYARFISLFNTTDRNPLERIDLRTYDDLDSESGKPYAYVIVGSAITLFPTPDAAYNLRLRYWKLPATMTSSGTACDPEIPSEYHHLLVDYALYKIYNAEHDYEASERHRQLFENDVLRMRSEVHSESSDGTKVVSGTWGESYLPYSR